MSYPTHIVVLTSKSACPDREILALINQQIRRYCACVNKAPLEPLGENHLICVDALHESGQLGQAAERIMRTVKGFCEDPRTQLHMSIGADAQVLGILAGHAFSLFARAQDRLSCLCVRANTDPLFAFSGGVVTLRDIPIVTARSGMIQKLLNGDISYEQSLKTLKHRHLQSAYLGFDLSARQVHLGEVVVDFPPVPFAVYLWLAKMHTQGRLPGLPGADLTLESFLTVCRSVFSRYSATYENIVSTTNTPEFFLQFFREKRSCINKRIKERLGEQAALPYLIASNGRRLHIQYRLSIKAENIRL